MKLVGKTAIVTGGGRDIGRACAIKLASEGANVAINYFACSTGAEETVAAIEMAGGRAIVVRYRISDDAVTILAIRHQKEAGYQAS